MDSRNPDPDRAVEGTTLRVVIERLAARVAKDSGGSELRALADIKAAVEANIRTQIRGDDEELLDRVGGGYSGPTWREIGEDLGVSAQAAHRKYGHKRRRDVGD